MPDGAEQHHRDEDHGNVGQIDLAIEGVADGGGQRDQGGCNEIRFGAERRTLRDAAARPHVGFQRFRRQHLHADVAGAAHQRIDHRAMQQLEPAGAARLADDDLGDVVGARVVQQVVGDVASGQRHRRRAQPFRQPQGLRHAVALAFRKLVIARRLDIERDPARLQPVGRAPRIADEAGRARMLVDADQDALARRPWARDGVGLHVGQHLVVDPLRGAAQRQLAQRGQVAFGEIVVERALRHFRHIDLALVQALDQIGGREVDQLDLVRLVDHMVGQGLAHPHRRDLRDHVVQALEVLDVQRRIDVDAGGQQLLDILVALVVPAARRVGVGQLVHQHQLRLARQDGVDVHLVQGAIAVRHLLARHDLEAVEQRFGLGALVGLDDADDDVDAFLAAGAPGGQHLVGLADAGGRAKKDLQPTAILRRRRQERFGRRT